MDCAVKTRIVSHLRCYESVHNEEIIIHVTHEIYVRE